MRGEALPDLGPAHDERGATALANLRPGRHRAARTRYGTTMVVATAVLFAMFGSGGDAAETNTVLVMVPLDVGLMTIVTVTELPL